MAMIRVVYISKYKVANIFGEYMAVLKDILEKAQKNNKARNVTGALLFDDEYFVQTLEGERDDVKAIFDKIGKDNRHFDIKVIQEAPVPARLFANWWMAGLLRGGKTAALFEPYQRDGRFDPSKLSGDELLALMQALTAAGADRRLATKVA